MEPDTRPARKPDWCRIRHGAPRVIAHRGHAERFPENTLIAFRAAVEAGAEMVELDYRATSDGRLVCAHDDTTERCVDLKRSPESKGRKISRSTTEEIARWPLLHKGFKTSADAFVPTLEQAIGEIRRGGAVPVLERKTGTPEQTFALLRRLDLIGQVCLQAFDWEFLRAVRAAEPVTPLAALGKGAFSRNLLPEIRKIGVDVINWDYYGLTAGDIRHLHQQGFPVWTWTLNRELEFHDAASMEIDAITTDAPDRLRSFLDANGPA